VSAPGAGFDHDTNAVVILGADGNVDEVPLTSKDAVGNAVLDRVIAHLNEKRSRT
jgi:phosphopantothenoylcysteine decarboxylase/phosphopantothenate--cysteine ligase